MSLDFATLSKIETFGRFCYEGLMRCERCDALIKPGKHRCTCGAWTQAAVTGSAIKLADVVASDVTRITTGPWDAVFGGGLNMTSTVLLGGIPGAGKSTLVLQMASNIAAFINANNAPELDDNVLYIAKEEEIGQIKGRADRLGLTRQHNIIVETEVTLATLEATIQGHSPAAIILDSLPGLVGLITDSQGQDVIEVCRILKRYAVAARAPSIIIDHVNKEDEFAGFMSLQHEVDALVSLFPTPRFGVGTCTLKTLKNRQGRAPVLVSMLMGERGLTVLEDMQGDVGDYELPFSEKKVTFD
jgi:DNA repair protein RadA/Sms